MATDANSPEPNNRPSFRRVSKSFNTAGGAFQEYPKLRPSTTVDCHVERTVDADGVNCLVIHIAGGVPTST